MNTNVPQELAQASAALAEIERAEYQRTHAAELEEAKKAELRATIESLQRQQAKQELDVLVAQNDPILARNQIQVEELIRRLEAIAAQLAGLDDFLKAIDDSFDEQKELISEALAEAFNALPLDGDVLGQDTRAMLDSRKQLGAVLGRFQPAMTAGIALRDWLSRSPSPAVHRIRTGLVLSLLGKFIQLPANYSADNELHALIRSIHIPEF